jgi:hypothetical protein
MFLDFVQRPVFYDLLSRWFLAKLIFSTLKMEAICSSETSVDTQRTTQRYIPEEGTLHNHRCENLISYIENRTFRKWDLFPSSGEGEETP